MKSVSSGSQVMTDNYNVFKYWPSFRKVLLMKKMTFLGRASILSLVEVATYFGRRFSVLKGLRKGFGFVK